MDTFKKFYSDFSNTSGTRRYVNGPRHRKHGFTDTDRYYRRQRQNLVGDMYKKDNSKNPKIEQLKKSNGKIPVNQADIAYIQQTYGIQYDGNPKKLGNTGIVLTQDPQTNTLIIMR